MPPVPVRHPSALYLLLVVEVLERFAFSAALSLLVLYLTEQRGLAEDAALLICHVGLAASYLAGWPCGWLADRFLGHAGGTLLGAALLLFGYGALALAPSVLLWPTLGLLLGAGALFRTSLVALLGRLYEEADPRRLDGFAALYFAVNLGYLAGPLYVDWAKPFWGWSWIFLSAGLAMFGAVLLLVMGWHALHRSRRADATPSEHETTLQTGRDRFKALLLLCGAAVVFFLASQQANGTLLLFTESHARKQLTVIGHTLLVGPERLVSFHCAAVLVLTLLGVGLKRWLRARTSAQPSTSAALVWGFVTMAAAFVLLSVVSPHGNAPDGISPWWLVGSYLLLSLAEVLLAPLGMALVTQLAPPQRLAMATGLWFASGAAGIALAGGLGLLWSRWSIPRYFALLAALSLGAAVVLLTRVRSLEAALRASNKP